MIANITTGSYTKGMVLYNNDKTINKTNKPSALFLGTNAIYKQKSEDIISAINRQNNLNRSVSKPNIHISLNFHKQDLLSNMDIYQIANDYMEQLGYGEQPYAVYRHFDTDHPHVHIVSSQIDINGKFINDSYLYRRSQRLTRELEIKYDITKAVDHHTVSSSNNIDSQINDYLKNSKGGLLPLLTNIINQALNKKPTSFKQLDYYLKKHNVVREEYSNTTKGHIFKIIPIDKIEQTDKHSMHKGISGFEIDSNYSFPAINRIILLNKEHKEKLLKNIQGRIFNIYNIISDAWELKEFILSLKKKGINTIIKRRQTGELAGKINGFIFKDIKTGHNYTASELKIKTSELLNKLVDDQFDLNTIVKISNIKEELILEDDKSFNDSELREALVEPSQIIESIFDGVIQLLQSNYATPENDTPLKMEGILQFD